MYKAVRARNLCMAMTLKKKVMALEHHLLNAGKPAVLVANDTVSQKKDTDLACYNSDVRQPILIISGKTVAKRVSYQITIYFFTSPN